MKKKSLLIPILILMLSRIALLNAQQPVSDLKSYFSGLQNKEVFFNDGTPPCIISQIADTYFIAKMANSISYMIPYQSICKIEIIKGKDKMITIFLYSHNENKSK